jgi:hypothetical protein
MVALPPEIADEAVTTVVLASEEAVTTVASEVAVTTVASEVAVTTVASEVAVTTASEVAVMTAALLALSGMLMGTPAAEQVDSTAEMAASRSSDPQASSTQGWTWARSWVPFWQWQAKSVKLEQPSVVRGPTKQFN